tara:strand:- start:344 stop:757 length:414 start_codon:yes stop_codon:yes gene_type:complete
MMHQEDQCEQPVRLIDLFGNNRVRIPGNPTLEAAATLVLEVVQDQPELLDGDKVGDIDRALQCAIWLKQGLQQILGPVNVEAFQAWFQDSRAAVNTELVRRARQHLAQHDYIRISAKAVLAAEAQRKRLTKTFGGRV